MGFSFGKIKLKTYWYWVTLMPLLAMFAMLYSQYKDQQKIINDSQRIYNRQIELITITHQQQIKKFKKD